MVATVLDLESGGVSNVWRVTPVITCYWIKKTEGIAPDIYSMRADFARMYIELSREMAAIKGEG